MRLRNVKLEFTGGVDRGKEIGNVKNMLLDIRKLKTYGWKIKHNSKHAIEKQPST